MELLREQCFINGQWKTGHKKIAVHNPFNHQLIGHVPDLTETQVDTAIAAAVKALPIWRNYTSAERAKILIQWAWLIQQNIEPLAQLLTTEQGKPLAQARGEIGYAASFIVWFAEEGKRIYGDVIPPPVKGHRLFVIKQAVGVVGAITPWNFPAAMITRKLAPALAAGCSVVLKPSTLTPFTALALADLAEQAGMPAGVINVITGDAQMIGHRLTTHPDIRKISFTGSTAIGQQLMAQASSTIKNISLELGGNAPFIVFDDADIDAAVKGAIDSKFRNMGQTCVCANRFFIHANIYDDFLTKFTEAVEKLQLGNGLTEGVDQGPLINEMALVKIEQLIANACEHGAKIITGGKRHELGGTFFAPTIITEVTPKMTISQTEIFGPVAIISQFTDETTVIDLANATPYGLAAYFYSKDIYRVWRVAEQLDFGIVGANTGMISNETAPFGGMKASGLGREGSKYGLEAFLEIKQVALGSGS